MQCIRGRIFASACCLPFSAHGELFKCATPGGAPVYQDKPCATDKETQKTYTTAKDKEDSDPIVASLKVYYTGYSLERMEHWCAAKSPSSVAQVRQARATWEQRHADLARAAGQILQSRLSQQARLEIAVHSRLEYEAIMAKLEPAGPTEHQKWCKDLPAKMLDPQFNMMGRPPLVKTIMNATKK